MSKLTKLGRSVGAVILMLCATARANPMAHAVSAASRIYMASERLTATISPDGAEMRGTFTFQYRQDVPESGRKAIVMLEIPIWFPEAHPRDVSVGEFWKTFPDMGVTEITSERRAVFEKALGLRVFLGNQPLSAEEFTPLTTTNHMQRWAPRDWQQEAGFCCLVFRFYIKDDSVLTQKPLTISYRQPLLEGGNVGKFYYLPVFQDLPKGATTTDISRYSITVVAKPGVSLMVSNGDQKSIVQPGHSITLSPRHHQAIRASVTFRTI